MGTQLRLQSLIRTGIFTKIWTGFTLMMIGAAGSLGVNPVRLEISHTRPTSVLTLENRGDTPKTYQIETFSWTQESGEDRYNETRDLVAVPPLFTLEPGQKQLVRIGVRRAAENHELAFRIFIQELPVDIGPRPIELSIRTLLRIGIPVFLAPVQPAQKPQLNWFAERSEAGITSLIVENPSALHVQIGRIKLGPKDDLTMAKYVLPGQRRRWIIPEPVLVSGSSVNLQIETDQGRMAYDATILDK